VAVLDAKNQPHEVTTFRKDIQTDGRRAVVEFGVSLMDDLARRDFTINAIAYHPLRHEWRDPFQGEQDLAKKLIRSVGDPNWRFQEDYLRILRALRFSARLSSDPSRTLDAAKPTQGLQLSAERVRDEWFKGILTAKKVSRLVGLWRDVGATRIWLPELGAGSTEQGAVDKLPRDPVLITAYLAKDPASLLTRLKCSNKEIERGRAIGQWREKYRTRRILSLCGGGYLRLAHTPMTVGAATRLETTSRSRCHRPRQEPLNLKDLAIRGDELIKAGVRPGPDVGETLQRLLDEVLRIPAATRASTCSLVSKALLYALIAAFGNVLGALAVTRRAVRELRVIELLVASGRASCLRWRSSSCCRPRSRSGSIAPVLVRWWAIWRSI
jgi:tRNA nucleotidyltransferase (CCA-adding enzyme)